MTTSNTIIEKYFEFCEENFPKSYWNSHNGKTKKIIFFKNINKSIELLKLLNGLKQTSENAKDLILDSVNYLKRILYCAPINDKIIYSSIMRGLSESLLRIAYSSIFPTESSDKIRLLKYRDLNESINNNALISTIMNKETKKILDFYGKYSNELHNKSKDSSNEIRFLSDILSNKSGINPDKVSSDSQSILDFCQKVLFFIFKIDDKSLSYSDKSKLILILK